jgi:hypothetical protein
MKLPHELLLKLSPLVEAARGEPLVEPFVDVDEDTDTRLVLTSSYGVFTFDKLQGQVLKGPDLVWAFDEIQSVDLRAFPGGLGARSWSVSLYKGVVDRVTVARTYDDGEASVVAAKISRIVGCKVIAFTLRR